MLKEAQDAYDAAADLWQTAKTDLQKAEDAKAQLEKSDPEAAKVNLDELRANLANSKAMESAKGKIRLALQKHVEVVTKLNVVNQLSPDGMRKTKLASKLDQFNKALLVLCEVAGWGPVTVDQEGETTLDGVRYALCARSGQMRIDVTLQVAFAMTDGSELILVDDADILDGKGRNGLFLLLDHSERYAVVGMMLIKLVQAPDLKGAGLGATWWINGAVATPLDEMKAAAKAA